MNRPGGRIAVKWDEQPLGRVPDAELARTLGVSRQAVVFQRNRRGIAPCGAEHALPTRDVVARLAIETGLTHALDLDRDGLSTQTVMAVESTPGWAITVRRRGARIDRARIRAPGRRWSDWMSAADARAWLLTVGWPDAAQAQLDALKKTEGRTNA